MAKSDYDRQVFINCPFDDPFKPLFEAITFAIFDCGFLPRCALEVDDGGQIRMQKILSIIADCKFGLHDISRTELDSVNGLPRFNMPLELGLFLGAKSYGGARQQRKTCLILDRDPYRYQRFVSDLAGQDIRTHDDQPEKAVEVVRNWLRSTDPGFTMPSGTTIWKRYLAFRKKLPVMCRKLQLVEARLTFADLAWLTSEWLKLRP
jgi:hypothetical protein